MKKIFSLSILLGLAAMMWATPAKRGVWRSIKLADGTEIRAELRGDEHASFWQAEDGVRYVRQAGAEYFTKADATLLAAQAEQSRMAAPLRSPSRIGIGADHQPFVGSKKGLIILAEFTDKKFQPGHDAEYYSHVANDNNFSSTEGHIGSIHDFFYDQSEGQFDLTFDVVGPVQLKYNMAYYGAHYGSSNDKNVAAMVKECVQAAATKLGSFAAYDWFGDGYVDQVFIIYAGQGEANGGGDDTIWPHRSGISTTRYGGKYVSIYACSNEMQSDTKVDGIGAFCHEFSHCLGLADLYDTAYSGNYGMGLWDIMDGGCYLGDSFRPCSYSGFERNYCGWKTPVVLTTDTEVTGLKGISEGGDYYIIYNDAYKNEYYVLENRNQTGWDAAMYGSGLLVTHIDFDKNIWASNSVNTTQGSGNDHQRYTPFLADNSTRQLYVDDIAGDLYPYKKNNQLTNSTTPAQTLYHANTDGTMMMSKPITNITKHDDGTVSFSFANEVDKEEEPLPEGTFFKETFDKCTGDGGNDEIWAPSTGDMSNLIADNNGWEWSDGAGGNKCAIFGATKKGTATTPEFTISDESVLTFKTAIYTSGGGTTVSLSATDGLSLSGTQFAMSAKKWCEWSVTVSAASYPATGRLTFSSNKGRFFLDEVLVAKSEPSGIKDVSCSPATPGDSRIYTLDGRCAGQDINALQRGIYIVNGKKVKK